MPYLCRLALVHLLTLLNILAVGQQNSYVTPAGTKFLLYTPPGYATDPGNFPLLVSLHSKGEVGDDLSKLTTTAEQIPARLIALKRWPSNLPFIVLTPQLKPAGSDPKPPWPADYIDEVINYVTQNFKVDQSRIYVTGISLGGTGCWTYASAYPDKVAALLPISGRSDLAQACAIKDIPVWAFHGDGDGTVVPAYSIDMINAIRSCEPDGAYEPRLTILNARGHNGWNEIYNGSNDYKVFQWLLGYRKNDFTNQAPYVNAGTDQRILLRSGSYHLAGDVFDFDGDPASVQWRQISGEPLALSRTADRLLRIDSLMAGTFEFELSAIDDRGLANHDRVILYVDSSTTLPRVTSITLMNGKTNVDLFPLSEDTVIDKGDLVLSEINLRAVTIGTTGSVQYSVNADRNTRVINSPGPYLIKSQTTSPEWNIATGEYVICATPFTQAGGKGLKGVTQCFKVTVVDGSCPGTGGLEREIWSNIAGTAISSIPLGTQPTSKTKLLNLEAPINIGDNYGSRIRGFVCPPYSGSYKFWIAGNDNSELWLSTTDAASAKVKIASVTGYTNSREWTKYPGQQSASITLKSGQKYYIEILHKEGTGADNVAVGWQLPDGTLQRPILANHTIPFVSNISPTVTITSPTQGQNFSEGAKIDITANANDPDGSVVKVEFFNDGTKLGEDTVSPFGYLWENATPGNHAIVVKAIDNANSTTTSTVNIFISESLICTGAGVIKRELWTGVTGKLVSSIPVNSSPSSVSELTIFETPYNSGENYGARVRGYVCVPLTGSYVFWISSDDNSELWLSDSDDPSRKRKIAYVIGSTTRRQWDKFTTQRSPPIDLAAGKQYYIEALHKEGTAYDNLAVGWQLPDGTLERPIPGNRLSPFDASISAMASVAPEIVEREEAISVFPNPAGTGVLYLKGLPDGYSVTPGILDLSGVNHYVKGVPCGDGCLSFDIAHLPKGLYFLKVAAGNRVHVFKVFIN